MSIPAQSSQTAVEYTISQDFAAGYIAEQEKNLQGFLEKGQEDLATIGPLVGSHKLQDYQMQLMLLEQQTKKRLLMARTEQDITPGKQEQERGLQALEAQQMATTRKRPRPEVFVDSAPASRIKRARPKGPGKSRANIQESDKVSVQDHPSLATAVNQDSLGLDISNLDRNNTNCSEYKDHEVKIDPHLRYDRCL